MNGVFEDWLELGDCLDVMRGFPGAIADAVIADPPYGTTQGRWDSVIPLQAMWAELRRVATPGAPIVLFCSQPFTSALIMSNPQEFRYCWIWEKPTGTGFLDAKRKPLRCHEEIAVFYRQQPTYNPQKWAGAPNHSRGQGKGRKTELYGEYRQTPSDESGLKYPRSVQRFAKHSSTERLHPTQKPLGLLEYLVRTYTNPHDTVLDFCMGSGTTGVACQKTNRNFIGIEKDPACFHMAQERLDDPNRAEAD